MSDKIGQAIDPLTGRPAIRAVRSVSSWPTHQQTSPPRFQYLRVPRVGNTLGAITLRLPNALIQTVQSSIVEVFVSVRIDGEEIAPIEIEVEDFYFEPVPR